MSGSTKGAKERVLAVWPGASPTRPTMNFPLWKITSAGDLGPVMLGEGASVELAWIDAAYRLPAAPPATEEECCFISPDGFTCRAYAGHHGDHSDGDGHTWPTVPPNKAEAGELSLVKRIEEAVAAIDAMKAQNKFVSDNDAAIVFYGKWQDAARANSINQEMLEALNRIYEGSGSNPGYTGCGCEDHNSPDCCNNANYCCPECIAGAAIDNVKRGNSMRNTCNLSDFTVTTPIWGMVEMDNTIGLRLDCGDGGVLKLSPEQARETIETLQGLLEVATGGKS